MQSPAVSAHLRPNVGKLLVLVGQVRQFVILVDETERRTALALALAGGLLALVVAAARYVEHGRRGGGQRVLVVRRPPAAGVGGLLGHATSAAAVRLRIGHSAVVEAPMIAVTAAQLPSVAVVVAAFVVVVVNGDAVRALAAGLLAATPPSPTTTARDKTSAVQVSHRYSRYVHNII